MLKKIFLNDKVIFGLILLNTLAIFFGGFDFNKRFLEFLSSIDLAVTIAFIVEAYIKIKYKGVDYFKHGWNVFDFILVLLSTPSIFAVYFHFQDPHVDVLLTLRILRVFRVFKTVRFVKFLPGVDHLLVGLARALKTSVIALVGYIIYIFIAGLLSFYMFRHESPEMFGDPLVSLYSIFKIFTVEGWFDIPEKITSNMSDIKALFTYLYFICILLSGGIIGLSLVNSLFVDAMVSDNNEELESKVDSLNTKIDILVNEVKKLRNERKSE